MRWRYATVVAFHGQHDVHCVPRFIVMCASLNLTLHCVLRRSRECVDYDGEWRLFIISL
jgi:hypothetical protein